MWLLLLKTTHCAFKSHYWWWNHFLLNIFWTTVVDSVFMIHQTAWKCSSKVKPVESSGITAAEVTRQTGMIRLCHHHDKLQEEYLIHSCIIMLWAWTHHNLREGPWLFEFLVDVLTSHDRYFKTFPHTDKWGGGDFSLTCCQSFLQTLSCNSD